MTIRYAPAPSGGNDQSVIQGLIDASADGDEIVFKSKNVGIYKHDAKIIVQNKPGITFRAESAFVTGNVEFQWDATTPTVASFHIWTASHRTKVIGLTHNVVGATTRNDSGFPIAPFVVDYADYVTLIDCTSSGSAGLGIYVFHANYGTYDRFRVLGSAADGFHLTQGSSFNTITDYYGERLGDDGCANIGYYTDGEAGRPHDNTWVRPTVVDCHARGISFAGCYNTRVIDPQITRTRASSILFARENGANFKTMPTRTCSVETTSTGSGQLRAPQTPRAPFGSSTVDPAVHTGFIIYDIGVAGEVTDCTVNGLNIGEGGSGTSSVAQSSNSNASSGSFVNNLQMYQGTPSTLWNGTAVSTTGWTDRRSTAMPAAKTSPVAQQLAVEGAGGSTGSTSTRRSPDQISGCVSWYRGKNAGTTTAGTAISSVSSTGGTAGAATQGTAANRPTYTATPKSGIDFSGSQQYLRHAGSASLVAETIVAIARPDLVNGDRTIRGADGLGGNGGAQFRFSSGFLNWCKQGVDSFLSGTKNPSTTSLGIYTGTRDASVAKLYVNGAADGSKTTPPTMSTGLTSVIGAGYDQNENFDGVIYDIINFNRVLTASELAEVHSWFADEYSITTADYVAPPASETGKFKLWDGTQVQSLELVGYWNGTSIEPLQVLGVYNGSTIDAVG